MSGVKSSLELSSTNRHQRRRSTHETAHRASAFGRDNSVNIEQSINRSVMRNSVAAVANLPSYSFDNVLSEKMKMPASCGSSSASVSSSGTNTPLAVSPVQVAADRVTPFAGELATPKSDALASTENRQPIDQKQDTENMEMRSANFVVMEPHFIANTVDKQDMHTTVHVPGQTKFRRNVRSLLTHPDISPHAKSSRLVMILEGLTGPLLDKSATLGKYSGFI